MVNFWSILVKFSVKFSLFGQSFKQKRFWRFLTCSEVTMPFYVLNAAKRELFKKWSLFPEIGGSDDPSEIGGILEFRPEFTLTLPTLPEF